MKGKYALGLIIGIMFLLVTTFANTVGATPWNQTVVYDDFNSGIINNTKWENSSAPFVIPSGGSMQLIVSNPSEVAEASSKLYPNWTNLNSGNFSFYITIGSGVTANLSLSEHSIYSSGTIVGTQKKVRFQKNSSNYSLVDVYLDNSFSETFYPNTDSAVLKFSVVSSSGSGPSYLLIDNVTYNAGNIIYNSPSDEYSLLNEQNVTFNVTIISAFDELNNGTLYIDGVANETYVSDLYFGLGDAPPRVYGNYSQVPFYKNLSAGIHKWSVKACDVFNGCYHQGNRTLLIGLANTGESYSSSVLEQKYNPFILNITYNTSLLSSPNATLNYNGINYSATATQSGNNVSFSASALSPSVNAPTSVPFYWIVSFGTGINKISGQMTTSSQTVNPVIFGLCNASLSTRYINITFKDELTLTVLNASINPFTTNYHANGTASESFTLVNNTDNYEYDFCFSPTNEILYLANGSISFMSTGYPARTYSSFSTYTNSSTDLILYLLSSTEGGYATFAIFNSQDSNPVSGAQVSLSRLINGANTIVTSGVSDSSGQYSTWLSPNFDYTVDISKSGCTAQSFSIKPSGSGSYNVFLNCGRNTTTYVSNIDGLIYQRGPADGINRPGNYLFEYYLNSTIYNITSAQFELVDRAGTTLATNLSTATTSYCNPQACYLSINYTVVSGDDVKGRYYVNLGNGSILIEKDAHWRFININQTNSTQAFTRFMSNLDSLFSQWGENNAECSHHATSSACTADTQCRWISTSSICIVADDLNKVEFNKIVFFFFGLAIIMFLISKATGYEMTNPGAFTLIMTLIIWVVSVAGFFTFVGLTPWDIVNKYLFAVISTVYGGGYMISIFRRYNQ